MKPEALKAIIGLLALSVIIFGTLMSQEEGVRKN